MSGATAIHVQGLGKRYKIGGPVERYGSLRESLTRGVTSRLGNQRKSSSASIPHRDIARTMFWALSDVSFEIQHGDVVGIIGRNGAGKSTLLKILSRVTEPTTGLAELYGRLGSLLEVGTGFHPELSGRENIYLNGAILGMGRADIRRHFDEIVAFAEVEKFVDTPVKRYSSGMYLRLAFAVAAHLEPEILVVDEVLAVGDAAFQKKCIGKMETVSREGRTVILVSHNLNVVRSLCSTTILLDSGRVVALGRTGHILRQYNNLSRTPTNLTEMGLANRLDRASGAVRFTGVTAIGEHGNEQWDFSSGETIRLRFEYEVFTEVPSLGLYFALNAQGSSDAITSFKHVLSDKVLLPGDRFSRVLELPDNCLRPGDYFLYLWLGDRDCVRPYDVVDKNVSLPSLQISSDETDSHRTIGYFSMPSRIIAEVQ